MENKKLIRLGKYLFAGSLIMTALLIIFSIVPKWSDGINELLDSLFKVDGNYIKAYPFVLLPLVTILFFLFTGFVAGLFLKSGKTEENEDEQKKGKLFFSYYLCAFALSSLLVFILSTAFVSPSTEIYSTEKIMLMAVIYFVTVIISLLQAALGLSAMSLWKSNMGVSILLLGIFAICLISTVVPGVILSNHPHYNSDDTYPHAYDELVAVDEVYEVYEEYDYEYLFDDDSSPFCNNMWDEPDNCESNVASALDYVRGRYAEFSTSPPSGGEWKGRLRSNHEDNHWIWGWNSPGYGGYRNFYKMVVFLKNNPSHLIRFFELYENVLYSVVSLRTYNKSAAPDLVNALTIAYDDLYSDGKKEGRRKCMEIYSYFNDDNRNWGAYLDFLVQNANNESLNMFRNSSELNDEHMIVWAYGFWGRRTNEGNAQATYTVLQKIAEHYR